MNALPTTGELFATNQVSPETERCYKYQLRNFAQWMREDRGVDDMEDVTTADLLSYRQSLQYLAASTQKRYLAAIKSFLAWALEAEIIPTNPAASLKLPRDVGLFWSLACGLRIAEVLQLEIEDLSAFR
jgi:site-specific recombinase XerD